MKIGNTIFDITKTHIMGILNVTPDSFSDGGVWDSPELALHRTEQMIREGAAIIDVGGESTRPGYVQISDNEEINRIAPIITAIKKEFDIPVSVDTYKSAVAHAALECGADMLNDIGGLKHGTQTAKEAAASGVPICIVHNRKSSEYKDFLNDLISDIETEIGFAVQCGVAHDKIIIDPGIGFAKSVEQNLKITNKLEILHRFDCPILYGASRKSMIGLTLDLPVNERLEATVALSALACMKGAAFVRVHDVKENYRAVKMIEAVKA